MKKNSARMLLCAGLCAAAVIGTGLISYAASSSDSAAAQTDSRMPPQEDGSVMAKITAAGDGSLTVTIARKPEGKNGDGTDGATGRPADKETPPEKPETGETMYDGQENRNPLDGQDKGSMTMEFGTDETTVYLTDSTVITKGRSGQEGSASDLAVGSIVRMVLEDAQIIRVDIME